MQRFAWTACCLWMLLLLCFVHNDRYTAFAELQLHYKSQPAASGFMNSSDALDYLIDDMNYAVYVVREMGRWESIIRQSPIRLRRNSISFALLLDNLPDERYKRHDRFAQVVLRASIQLMSHHCLSGEYEYTAEECARDIATVPLPARQLATCEGRRAETAAHPNVYRRLLPAVYADGFQMMPYDRQMPLPKTISDTLHHSPKPSTSAHIDVTAQHMDVRAEVAADGPSDAVRNTAVVQWAQFVEHDLAKTVFRIMGDKTPIECCDDGFGHAPWRYRHPSCAAMTVETRGSRNTCLNYVRSALGVSGKCTFGPAEQLNQATSQLDLSQLYGHGVMNRWSWPPDAGSGGQAQRFVDGELLSNLDGRRSAVVGETLPEASGGALCMHDGVTSMVEGNRKCYKSGDSRCNANPIVTPLYTLFLRSHNRIARTIRQSEPAWTDTRIYQEARRINTALYAHVIYSEWLPTVVGDSMIAQMAQGVSISSENANNSRPVSNEWATTAARFYYSMMPGALRLESRNPNIAEEIVDLKQEFYRPRDLSANGTLDRMMMAILEQRAQAMDTFYVDDVSQYLFRSSADQDIGTDALALDIQRSRDHGLAGYTAYVELCTGRTVSEWDQLRSTMNEKTVDRLRTIYTKTAKIDLIVGGAAETPLPGASVGPTFACLFGEQFARSATQTDVRYETLLRDGRYGGAQFVCENTELTAVPQNIFHVASADNPMVECAEQPKLCAALGMC